MILKELLQGLDILEQHAPEQLRRVLRLANIPCADGASQEETR